MTSASRASRPVSKFQWQSSEKIRIKPRSSRRRKDSRTVVRTNPVSLANCDTVIDHRDQLATLLIGHRSFGAQGLELFLRAGTGGIRQTLRMVRQNQEHLDIGAL